MPRGRSPSVKKKKGGNATEQSNTQVLVILSTTIADTLSRGVPFREDSGAIHVEADPGMRPYAYRERRRPAPTPKGWLSTDEARMTIELRDHLRAIRKGRELALQIDSDSASDATLDTPIVTHASDLSLLGGAATGSRRWVVDSGSWVDIVGEGSVTKEEKACVEEASSIPLTEKLHRRRSSSFLSDHARWGGGGALIIKGCPNAIVAWERMWGGRYLYRMEGRR